MPVQAFCTALNTFPSTKESHSGNFEIFFGAETPSNGPNFCTEGALNFRAFRGLIFWCLFSSNFTDQGALQNSFSLLCIFFRAKGKRRKPFAFGQVHSRLHTLWGPLDGVGTRVGSTQRGRKTSKISKISASLEFLTAP